MEHAKIAIVILNWNGEKLLPQFLPSVIQHSQLEGTEIIVADNGSTDSSMTLLEKQFPEVTRLQLPQNYGFALGYNEALKQIDAQYYILLNSDVEVVDGWLEPMISIFENDPAVAAVQPKILSWHNKQEFEYGGAAGGYIDKLGFPFCRGRILNVVEKDEGQYNDEVNIFWASGACFAVRASLYHKAGGFDSDFWAHMEEIDLCWRLKNFGYQIRFTPFSQVYHLGGGSLPYNNPRKLFLNFRNSLFMLYKNCPPNRLFQVLVVRMILDAFAGFKLLAEGNPKGLSSVCKAHWALYSNWNRLKAKRRQLKTEAAPKWHDEILCKSLIWKFYLQKKRTFRELINS
ncbi:glycosyltransferase family 2 protein [Mangrovibacterium lignilyticum]|uniref:glycosyltransferase family 2 protein n=1 Tax=Mangrovibacterium lignilyticum TaxID=2668052 RepID=UPI0013D6B93D|nr:glycosyltransferase family 2 protein [Mangrovibacterium lignilyticum]